MADVNDGVTGVEEDVEEPGNGYAVARQYGVPDCYFYVISDVVPRPGVYGYSSVDDAYRLYMMGTLIFLSMDEDQQADLVAYWGRLVAQGHAVGLCVDPRVNWDVPCDADSCRDPVVRVGHEAFTFKDWDGLLKGIDHIAHKLARVLQHARGQTGPDADPDDLDFHARLDAWVWGSKALVFLQKLLPEKARLQPGQRSTWPGTNVKVDLDVIV